MANKKFISFLGTGNYSPAAYYYENDNRTHSNSFVQVAISDLVCSDFGEDDEIIILMTEQSKEKNWESPEGLKNELRKLGLKADLKTEIVDAPFKEGDVRSLFNSMAALINEGDEVIIDITHGFRSFGVVAMSIVNYIQTAKGATISDILYGAYEVPEDKKPIVSLSSVLDIEEWTHAIGSFLETGNPNAMTNLSKREIGALYKNKSKVATEDLEVVTLLSQLAGSLNNLYDSMMKTRSIKIISDYEKIKKNLLQIDEYSLSNNLQHPLVPMVEQIKELVLSENENSDINVIYHLIHNYLLAYDYYQPAITLAQEMLVSWLGKEIGYSEDELKEEGIRNKVQYSLIDINHPKEEASKHKEDIISLLGEEDAQELANTYNNLSELRNDLNHAGTKKKQFQGKTISENAVTYIKTIKDLLDDYTSQEDRLETENNKVLLSVISHDLSDHQKKDAQEHWSVATFEHLPKNLQDIWSNIDSQAKTEEVDLQAIYDYIEENFDLSQLVLLVQGEWTATFKLVHWAQARDITVVHTTTERVSEDKGLEDGSVETLKKFKHVRFREYPKGE